MSPPRPTWTHIGDATTAELRLMEQADQAFNRTLVDRVLAMLKMLDFTATSDTGLMPITRYEHSLQSATLAHRDGRDENYVICCLLHDLGDTLTPYRHQDLGAAIVEPFVSEQNHWMVKNHAVFQGYYYYEKLGCDRNARDQYKDHPYYEVVAEFCAKYDAPAFDPSCDTLPLEFFEPMLRRVMTQPTWAQDDSYSGISAQLQFDA
ncbi:MAG: HD domain-containing protein [Cyanobacteria bacterium P01_F01_bin.4]